PGCGKTLFATEFLVRGALEFDEPGVFMSFEETAKDLSANVASLGFDLPALIAAKKLRIDHVRVERSEIEETGDYDLDGLFVRLGHAIDAIGARRVALDTVETLFSGFGNEGILRAELRRLFHWLKERGVTAVVTGERGNGALTRHGLEEYISDCVIVLDHRVNAQISIRRLRILKYRGSTHGTNEYPFLLDESGFSVIPITSATLDFEVSEERVSSGIEGLDDMLCGGFFRGSTIMVSGTAGTGKSITCAHFADGGCRRGERTLYFAFEESPAQIQRNVRSVGIDLRPHLASGLLRFHAARPSLYGLEGHLARILREIGEFQPRVVVLDPVTSLMAGSDSADVRAMITRLIDSLKTAGITSMMSTLTTGANGGAAREESEVGISSLVDSWILLRDIELGGERNRGIYILKSRGMAHSNQIREFLITSGGVKLLEVYLGPEGVLTGSARVAQEARERTAAQESARERERARRRATRKQVALGARIAALQAELDAARTETEQSQEGESARQGAAQAVAREIARRRHADAGGQEKRR
ncbi:MAG TPA: circadian clock protein KaiC, partial [Longimicrobiales bacterium]